MKGIGVTTAMIVVQFLNVGLNTLIKASIAEGMSNYVFVVYSNILGLCLLLPSTIIYHRKIAIPPITTWIIIRMFVLSLLCCLAQTFLYAGIRYSSPTLASTMEDLTPAYTFILAIISRMEKLDLKLPSCLAKSIGTVVSIVGALTMTLYKGLPLTFDMLPNIVLDGTFLTSRQSDSEWLFGGFLLAVGTLCSSLMFVTQTWVIRDYPSELMLTTISCGFVVILSAIIALIAEQNPKVWILKPDMELVSILYSAIFVISVRSVVNAWAFRKKGPVYVAMFNPLGMIIALAMGLVFLGDALYLGSLIGAAIIAIGFYAVIWGQSQEEEMAHGKDGTCSRSSSSSTAAPLLQNKSMEV